MLVWLLRLMVLVLVLVKVRKPNNVLSGSQQADRWRDVFLWFFSIKVFIQLLKNLLPQ